MQMREFTTLKNITFHQIDISTCIIQAVGYGTEASLGCHLRAVQEKVWIFKFFIWNFKKSLNFQILFCFWKFKIYLKFQVLFLNIQTFF